MGNSENKLCKMGGCGWFDLLLHVCTFPSFRVFFFSFFCGNVVSSFFFFQILVFCSKTVFNLSRKVLTATEKRVLEKGLRFAPAPIRINESVLKRDFNDFFLKMRCK